MGTSIRSSLLTAKSSLPDGVVLKDHTFTVMYNGKKEFHLSIEVDESLTPFINNKTDKVIIELEE